MSDPGPKNFRPAVAWLGGRDLLANLKYFALFALSAGKLDMRDWMTPSVFPDGELDKVGIEKFWSKYSDGGPDEFWFDYIADCGDGMQAGFSMAYILLSDLQITGPVVWTQLPYDVRLQKLRDVDEDTKVLVLDTPTDPKFDTGTHLPRGSFLFVGGDTTYHVADYASLAERFGKPFSWAIDQLCEHEGREVEDIQRRPLFGIPGNHDYYDELDGFNRQFRKPITAEDRFLDLHGRNMPPLLRIQGFERFQSASYVALRLPFDWWFWGMDCEIHRLDLRQQEFFKSLQDLSGGVPRKLIVATPEPTTVEGKRSTATEKTAQAFVDVRLTQPFLYHPGSPTETVTRSAVERERSEKTLGLNPFECRLDISGDTHHYTRYWGDDQVTEDDVITANYASVVSGGGGASMSPTQVDVGEIPAQIKYPQPKISSRIVNNKLFNPLSVFMGGNVFAAGMVIAVILFLAAGVNQGHSEVTDRLLGGPPPVHAVFFTGWLEFFSMMRIPGLLILGIWMIFAATLYAKSLFDRLTKTYDLAYNFQTNIEPEDSPKDLFTGLLSEISGETQATPSSRIITWLWALITLGFLFSVVLIGLGVSRFFGNPGSAGYGWLRSIEIGLVIGSLLLSVLSLRFGLRTYRSVLDIGKHSLKAETRDKIIEVYELLKEHIVGKYLDYGPFWCCSILGILWVVTAIVEYYTTAYAVEAGQALFFFLGVSLVVTLIVGSILYSAWLFAQSYRIQVTRFSYIPVIFYNVIATFLLAAFVWQGGAIALRTVAIDVILIIAVLAVLIGCVYLAIGIGNKADNSRYKALFGVFGLWHGLLQLATPFLLIWMGGWLGAIAGLLLILLLANPLIRPLLVKLAVKAERPGLENSKKNELSRVALTVIWFVVGSIFLVLPFVINRFSDHWTYGYQFEGPYRFWAKSLSLVLAIVLGAFLSCFWLGWYFAIALLFHGHGNEAGSTARTEDYKQFIRFRLTNETLTGYVIGIDKVKENGALLKAHLVDVIYLKCRPLAPETRKVADVEN